MNLCRCGTQAGYQHDLSCPWPYYGRSAARIAAWEDARALHAPALAAEAEIAARALRDEVVGTPEQLRHEQINGSGGGAHSSRLIAVPATPHDASPVAARRAFSDDDLGLYELVGAPPAARRYVDDPECLVCSPGPCFAGCPSLS